MAFGSDPFTTLNLSANGAGALTVPYDGYAAMAFAAEAKSKGLGALGGAGFAFTTAGEVNLQTAFGPVNSGDSFNDKRPDHSGQFNLDNMRRHKYWNVLLKRFGIKPVQDVTPTLGNRPPE